MHFFYEWHNHLLKIRGCFLSVVYCEELVTENNRIQNFFCFICNTVSGIFGVWRLIYI